MITHANQWQCTVLHVGVFNQHDWFLGKKQIGHLFLADESP